MNIAIVGYGKMGQVVHALARGQSISVGAVIDPNIEKFKQLMPAHSLPPTATTITQEILRGITACIEFTEPKSAVTNLETLATHKIATVTGTTGWYEAFEHIARKFNDTNTPLIYGANFSVGMNIFLKLLDNANHLLAKSEIYDLAIRETHHTQKKDAPSGTALAILKMLNHSTPIPPATTHSPFSKKINISSTRVGHHPGEHEVILDSEFDTISLKHTARNRNGFALGAIWSAMAIQNFPGGAHNFYNIFDKIFNIINTTNKR